MAVTAAAAAEDAVAVQQQCNFVEKHPWHKWRTNDWCVTNWIMIKLPGCPNNYLIPLNCSSIFHEKRLIIANIEYVCVCDPKFEQGLSLVACHFWVINVSVYFLFFVTRNRFPWMLSRVKHIRSPFKQTYLARAGRSLLTCLVFCSPDIVVILFSVFLSHSLFLCASVCVCVVDDAHCLWSNQLDHYQYSSFCLCVSWLVFKRSRLLFIQKMVKVFKSFLYVCT